MRSGRLITFRAPSGLGTYRRQIRTRQRHQLVRRIKLGALLLNGKFKEAIDVILQPKMKESAKIKQAKEKYIETQDAQEALENVPQIYAHRTRDIRSASGKGRENDFSGQLLAIPSKMKRMYIKCLPELFVE